MVTRSDLLRRKADRVSRSKGLTFRSRGQARGDHLLGNLAAPSMTHPRYRPTVFVTRPGPVERRLLYALGDLVVPVGHHHSQITGHTDQDHLHQMQKMLDSRSYPRQDQSASISNRR